MMYLDSCFVKGERLRRLRKNALRERTTTDSNCHPEPLTRFQRVKKAMTKPFLGTRILAVKCGELKKLAIDSIGLTAMSLGEAVTFSNFLHA